MKKYLTAASLTVLALAGAAIFAVPSMLVADDSADESANSTVTAVFKVEGMTCGGCEVGVRMNVKKLDGVEEVEASYEKGRAEVTYDAAKVTLEQIEAAIERLGYAAEPQEPEETKESSGR